MDNPRRTCYTKLSGRVSDRLSELPSNIIHDILGLIPLREAVRTCVLSKEWRYTWTKLPCLLFNEKFEIFDDSTNFLVNEVLRHHKGSVDRVEMAYSTDYEINSLEEWVLSLSKKDVRELSIQINSLDEKYDGTLESSIYKCAKLIKLELMCFKLTKPPASFKGFLNLKSIVFLLITMSPTEFESLVGHCPVLESLAVVGCSMEEIRISSPNLKTLQIFGGKYRKLSLHAPLLDKMYVDLSTWYGPLNIRVIDCYCANFLVRSINHTKLREERFFTTQYWSIGLESYLHTSVLHHLKVIDLRGVSFTNITDLSVVARLITDAPNLNKLEIQALLRHVDEAPDVCFRDYFGFALNFTLEKLKKVSLPFVCHYPSGMKFVKFLLECSPVLEIMELELESGSHFDKLAADISGFHRASPNAVIRLMAR